MIHQEALSCGAHKDLSLCHCECNTNLNYEVSLQLATTLDPGGSDIYSMDPSWPILLDTTNRVP